MQLTREKEIACARWYERLRTLQAVRDYARHIMNNPNDYASDRLPPADPRTAAMIAVPCSAYIWPLGTGDRFDSKLNLPVNEISDFSLAEMDAYRKKYNLPEIQ